MTKDLNKLNADGQEPGHQNPSYVYGPLQALPGPHVEIAEGYKQEEVDGDV